MPPSRDAIVLVPGYVEALPGGRVHAGGTVTLITGDPSVIVDTGAPEQQQQIVDALATHGVDPDEIQWVVNTHGHLDHVGNNNLFPQATFILDSDLAKDGEYWTHDFRQGPLTIASDDGGPAIVVMPTPGHTDHDLSVIVEASIGTVAVVGDLFEYDGDSADDAWLAWSRDRALQQASRDAVLAIADHIIPGHGDRFATHRMK
jgi:glyoxylase-like metal-dependent hydrolase (beta-lactamase superfamily II)